MIHTKRITALILSILMILSLIGCGQPAAAEPIAEPTATPVPELTENLLTVGISSEPEPMRVAEEVTATEEEEPSFSLTGAKPTIGMIIADDGSLLMRCGMHGFLRTAENLNYPARLYRYEMGSSPMALVDQAVADGCQGLLVWADTAELAAAAKYASSLGVEVIIPYADVTTEDTGAQAVLSPDPDDYCAEAVRLMCETTISRGNTTGIIVVAREAGAHQDIVDACQRALDAFYPGFALHDMPLAQTQAESEEAAKKFIKENRNICGILGLSPTSATVWYNGEIAAEKEGDFKVTPVIMGLDYTEENISLVSNSKIYCLIARPYYTAAAQAMMVMDSLLHGVIIQENIRVNAPMIRKKDIEKYSAIVSEVKEWFGM